MPKLLRSRLRSFALVGSLSLLALFAQASVGARTGHETDVPVVEVSSTRTSVSEGSATLIPSVSEPTASAAADQAGLGPSSSESDGSLEPVAPASAQALATVAAPAPVSVFERWASAGIQIVQIGQELDQESLSTLDTALSYLPDGVIEAITGSGRGVVYVLVNTEGRTLSGNQPYGRAANFFSTNEGDNQLVLYPRQSAQTVVHELGHAYNLRNVPAGRYALVLLQPEMESFMSASGWTVLASQEEIEAARDHMSVAMTYDGPTIWPVLSHDDPLEDYANSFALYFMAPDELRALSQARYDWFAANFGR